MTEQLILITNYYPFHKGEEYLESEIKFLSKEFDQILIIPTMVSNSMQRTRVVPNNCKVISYKFSQNKVNRVKTFLKYIPRMLFMDKELIMDASNLNPYKIVYNLYVQARALDILDRLVTNKDIIRFMTSNNNTVIYSYWFYLTCMVSIGLKKEFNKADAKLISRGHGYDVNEHLKPFNYLPFRKYMLANIDYLYTVSNISRDNIRNKYPLYKHKIETRRLGALDGEFIEENNEKLIVSCSTVRTLKRIDVIIDALKNIDMKKHNLKWIHIGDGPQFEEIKRKAEESLQTSSFKLIGNIPNSEIKSFYRENKPFLFINTSSSEGVPVSIMEALSYSIPVIASDVGGTKELLIDGYNGFLISQFDDVLEVTNKINDFLNMDINKYKQMRENAYKSWDKDWNAEKLYNNFAKELKKYEK
ncbi:glycosyltransferase [Macrococcus armenti]|uniref:glycosyltransferase n=1 Tax=Macrococcus armenti TaxID=2875764 RepID=UPI001CD2C2E9|nr:glycosyltransferase [Macrococcus armenti]UBH11659.1 glycosyltransferase [Macrococcus armenti]